MYAKSLSIVFEMGYWGGGGGADLKKTHLIPQSSKP